jgi:hypothetical protein
MAEHGRTVTMTVNGSVHQKRAESPSTHGCLPRPGERWAPMSCRTWDRCQDDPGAPRVHGAGVDGAGRLWRGVCGRCSYNVLQWVRRELALHLALQK